MAPCCKRNRKSHLENTQTVKKLISEVIQLDKEERDAIEKAIPKVVDTIKKDEVSGDESVWVTSIPYKMASGEDAKVRIFYSDRRKGVEGMYNAANPSDLQDNVIVLYKAYFSKYFGLKAKLTGTEKKGEDQIRRVLTHELVHAKDPALNHKKGNKQDVDSSEKPEGQIEADYFRSEEEVIAFASQLNEIIIKNVKDWITKHITDDESKLQQAQASNTLENEAEEIQTVLREILKFFSGQDVELSEPSRKFVESVISQSGFEKFMTKIYNFLEKLGLSKRRRDPLESYKIAVDKIKQFNEKGYQRLLTSLSKTLQKLELSINVLFAKEFRERKARYEKALKKYNDSQDANGNRNPHFKPKTWEYPINLLQISVSGNNPVSVTPISQNNKKNDRVIQQTNAKLLDTRNKLYPKKPTKPAPSSPTKTSTTTSTPTARPSTYTSTSTAGPSTYTITEAKSIIKQVLREIHNR